MHIHYIEGVWDPDIFNDDYLVKAWIKSTGPLGRLECTQEQSVTDPSHIVLAQQTLRSALYHRVSQIALEYSE